MKRKRTPETEDETPSGTNSTDLDQLIEERKQEKRKLLKEKLEQKLKIIRDRRVTGVNNEPFPEDAFERLRCINLWEDIFSYLREESDILSAYFTCGTFAEILEERQIRMTLQKVLNVFKTKIDEAYDVEGGRGGAACYQNWNTICLSARSVCKAWKETVDFHCHITRDEWFLSQATHRKCGYWRGPKMFVFNVTDEKTVDNAQYLINEGFTISPIRDMKLFDGDHSTEQYCRKLMEYLKTHGGSARLLYFYHGIPGINPAATCQRLGDMLKCMKNLRELHLVFHNRVPELGDANQDIEDVLNEHPLPVLESVVHFFCVDGETQQFLVSQILSKCINLKSLNLHLDGRLRWAMSETLVGLTLERFIGCASIVTSFGAHWPLKSLELSELSELNASVIFPTVNHFRDTLEHLYIWKAVKMDTNTRNVRLELSHLKSFCIGSIRRGTLGFDDLLPLKSMENVTVRWDLDEDEDALVKVKGYLESGEMHKSNVWQCFPNLMWFRLVLRDQCFRQPSSS